MLEQKAYRTPHIVARLINCSFVVPCICTFSVYVRGAMYMSQFSRCSATYHLSLDIKVTLKRLTCSLTCRLYSIISTVLKSSSLQISAKKYGLNRGPMFVRTLHSFLKLATKCSLTILEIQLDFSSSIELHYLVKSRRSAAMIMHFFLFWSFVKDPLCRWRQNRMACWR